MRPAGGILVFGKTGQVATELARQAQVTSLGRDQGNLCDPAACGALIDTMRPSAVINAAAYTNVDGAEDHEDLATTINGNAPTAMALAAARANIPFIHISSDYVFDGSGTQPRDEGATPRPLNAYGRSKLLGERGVADAGGPHVILRTSWVFSATGQNFVKTMLRLADTNSQLRVVADQFGGPTAAGDIASACLSIVRALNAGKGASGVFHFSGAPDVSWADFARQIFAQENRDVVVKDIPSHQFPTRAQRPLNSGLDCRAITRTFGIHRPDWQASLQSVLNELKVENHDQS